MDTKKGFPVGVTWKWVISLAFPWWALSSIALLFLGQTIGNAAAISALLMAGGLLEWTIYILITRRTDSCVFIMILTNSFTPARSCVDHWDRPLGESLLLFANWIAVLAGITVACSLLVRHYIPKDTCKTSSSTHEPLWDSEVQ
jgi:hypothetical protein